ncbi:MAG: protein translocase subunit SecDF, partial [Ferruginibacter sp.]
MRLKGLVWFFTIVLLLISVWEISYTFVVKSYEGKVQAQAERIVKNTSANLPADEKAALIKAKVQHILDSTKDKSIYPLVGTTYQKCKENELNLGLDLQGGISVTMDVSLEGLLKSLSNNPKDPALLAAINSATAQKVNSDDNLITLFSNSYIQQNGANKLASLFAGPGKDVKVEDNDATVISKIKTVADGAINQTYKILLKRIDKFGVAQPNINLDASKGIINVELAGITDAERVRKYLQSSANLQFWEVYNIGEIAEPLKTADNNLHNYLNGVSAADTSAAKDSAKIKLNQNPFFRIINPIEPQQDKNGVHYAAAIGSVAYQDTATL